MRKQISGCVYQSQSGLVRPADDISAYSFDYYVIMKNGKPQRIEQIHCTYDHSLQNSAIYFIVGRGRCRYKNNGKIY